MQNMLEIIVKALDEKQAKNIVVIDMSITSPICDGFIICSANNERLLNAIKENVIEKLEENGYNRPRIEGLKDSKWLLLDCKDYVVHIFDEEERNNFNLEKLWGDLPMVDISEYIS